MKKRRRAKGTGIIPGFYHHSTVYGAFVSNQPANTAQRDNESHKVEIKKLQDQVTELTTMLTGLVNKGTT
jgi:hypothetical protein